LEYYAVDETLAGGVTGFNQGEILNCSVSGSVNGTSYAGGIAAYNSGVIMSCYNAAEVVAAEYGGGIAAYSTGEIDNCGNTGSVTVTTGAYPHGGGIVGQNLEGTIRDSYNSGSIISERYTGGIAGMHDGIISRCYNTGSVLTDGSNPMSGGIAGYSDGFVEKCYNTGAISAYTDSSNGYAYAGGIVGEGFEKSEIENCYNTGNIESIGETDVGFSFNYGGGIAGYIYKGSIDCCYNVGSVTARYDFTGGIVGDISYDPSNCYYLNTVSTGIGTAGLKNVTDERINSTVKCSSAQMSKQETFVGFDFDTVWKYESNSEYKYPALRGVGPISLDAKADRSTVKYSLTTDTADELLLIVAMYSASGKTREIRTESIEFPDDAAKIEGQVVFASEHEIGDYYVLFVVNATTYVPVITYAV